MQDGLIQHELEEKARYTAKRAGLVVRKSHVGVGGLDNFGGFQLVDPTLNCVVAGSRWELQAQDVLNYCA